MYGRKIYVLDQKADLAIAPAPGLKAHYSQMRPRDFLTVSGGHPGFVLQTWIDGQHKKELGPNHHCSIQVPEIGYGHSDVANPVGSPLAVSCSPGLNLLLEFVMSAAFGDDSEQSHSHGS